MLVVSFSDFSANPSQYMEKAKSSGIKILPQKKEEKLTKKQRNIVDILNSVKGIVQNSDVSDELLKESYFKEKFEIQL